MKRILIYTLVAFLASALLSCTSTMKVYTDFDKSIEVHRLVTYTWLQDKPIESRNNPLFYNELNDKRIKAAVNSQLAKKGYSLSDKNAQLMLHYHLIIEDKTLLETNTYGYKYGIHWTANEPTTVRYQEGTLIVDFMDAQNCNLIWRGWAVSVLNDEDRITEDLIDRAVEKIFQEFPTSTTKETNQP